MASLAPMYNIVGNTAIFTRTDGFYDAVVEDVKLLDGVSHVIASGASMSVTVEAGLNETRMGDIFTEVMNIIEKKDELKAKAVETVADAVDELRDNLAELIAGIERIQRGQRRAPRTSYRPTTPARRPAPPRRSSSNTVAGLAVDVAAGAVGAILGGLIFGG